MSSGSVALQLFWDLSSSSADSRHAAALQLTKALRLAQKTADTAGDAPADEKAAALRADGGVLGSEVTYSVRRLIKGLASSREGSREGFALGLCLLLRSFSYIDCGRLLQTMIELLPVKGGGLSDTEIKENNFGRLFGCMALIQTGKCTPSASEWSAAVKASTVEELPCVKVLDELARLQGSKSFMAEATTYTASQMMSVALAEAPADVLADILLPRLRKGSEGLDVAEMTPEQLQLHLFSQNLILPGKPACLKETEIGKLVEPLKKATCSHPRLHQVWTQLLDIVATFQGTKSKADRVGERWGPASLEVLKSMWLQVVEDALMVSSHERKYAALLLVQQLVPQLPPHAITMLLSPNMRRTLCNNLGKKQCLLYKAAHTTLEALMSRAASEPSFALALLQLLVKEQRNFDKVTHTRTTSQLLECLDEKGKMEYLTLLLSAYREAAEAAAREPIKAEGEDDDEEEEGSKGPTAGGRQRWALESIFSLVTRQRARLPSALLESVLAWLMHTAFFKPALPSQPAKKGSKKNGAAVSAAVGAAGASAEMRELCMARFFTLLETLASRTTTAAPGTTARPRTEVVTTSMDTMQKDVVEALLGVYPHALNVCEHTAQAAARSAGLETSDPQLFWPIRAHLIRQALIAQGVEPLVPWNESVIKVERDMWKTSTELLRACQAGAQGSEQEVLQARQTRALALLFLQTGIELLSDTESAVKVVLELHECHQRILALRRKPICPPCPPADKKKKAAVSSKRMLEEPEDGAGAEEDEDEIMAVLVELLVSLLARPSAMLRNVVKATFRAFADKMTPSTIEVLVQVLSESGAELFADADEGDDEDDEDDEDDDEDDDDDDDDMDEDEDDEAQVAAALSKQEAGGKGAKASAGAKRKVAGDGDGDGEGDSDEDSEEDDEDDWDDEKMFEIDHLVAAAFKSRLQEQRLAKQTSSMSMVLKLRTLELVEVLLTRKEPQPVLLLLLEPLLQLAISGGGGDKQVGESAQQRVSFHARVSSLYADKLCRLRPAPAVASSAQAKEVVGMVERLCERMAQHSELAGAGITFLLRVLAASSKQHPKALPSALLHVRAILQKWASKKHSNVNPLFFSQMCERQASVGWMLAADVVTHAQTAPSDFHRTTCFDMLLSLARQSAVLKQEGSLMEHAHRMLQELPPAVESALAEASGEESGSKKVTKMLQSALAVALKCVELEEQLKTGVLDLQRLGRFALAVASSSAAARAKSVAQAAVRLQQRAVSKTPKLADQEAAAKGKGGAGKLAKSGAGTALAASSADTPKPKAKKSKN